MENGGIELSAGLFPYIERHGSASRRLKEPGSPRTLWELPLGLPIPNPAKPFLPLEERLHLEVGIEGAALNPNRK